MGEYVPVVMGTVCTLLGTLILMLWNGLKAEITEIKNRLLKIEERETESGKVAVLEEKTNRCESDLKALEQRVRCIEVTKLFQKDS